MQPAAVFANEVVNNDDQTHLGPETFWRCTYAALEAVRCRCIFFLFFLLHSYSLICWFYSVLPRFYLLILVDLAAAIPFRRPLGALSIIYLGTEVNRYTSCACDCHIYGISPTTTAARRATDLRTVSAVTFRINRYVKHRYATRFSYSVISADTQFMNYGE